jgi:hypothetical protein
MPSLVTADVFVTEWRRYLLALQGVAERQLAKKEHVAFKEHLAPLLQDVFQALLAEDSMGEMHGAVQEELADVHSRQAVEFLCRELIFFAEWQGSSEEVMSTMMVGEYASTYQKPTYGYDKSDDPREADGPDALNAGKTIKDSAEGLIKRLPAVGKRALKVLNELLSIIRGGT